MKMAANRWSRAAWTKPAPLGNLLLGMVLLLLCGVLFFHRLGDRDLNVSHEARAAQNGQVLRQGGPWGLPRLFNGRLELQKPPLYYWLVAGVAYLRDLPVDGWAVRLPSAVAACLTVMLLWGLGWCLERPALGLQAGLILATCVHFTYLARIARIDMVLTLAVTLALASFYLGQRPPEEGGRRWPWFVLFYLAVAGGILLKGPIAVVLIMATVASWSWLEKRYQPLGATLWWGTLLVLLVAAPWFLWANAQTDNRLWEVFFWYHNVERGLGGAGQLATHPWWFYGPRLLVDLLPWSLFFPWALWLVYRKKWLPADPLLRLGLIWFASQLLILSLMRFKRADYLLPAYPGAALFLAGIFTRWRQEPAAGQGNKRWLGRLQAVAIAGCLLGWLGYLHFIEPCRADFDLAQRFGAEIRNRTDQPVIFFRTEAHAVAFHVRPPLDTILEWENLEVWANHPQPIYVVMPPDCALVWREYLSRGQLEEVLRTTDLQGRLGPPLTSGWGQALAVLVDHLGLRGEDDRPLVLLRSVRPRSVGRSPGEP